VRFRSQRAATSRSPRTSLTCARQFASKLVVCLRADVKKTFAALFDAVCELEIEGVVAKRLTGHYRPGERKIKNRDYCRYEVERESAINKCRQRVFV
jgi:hypothetical protein